ncbi:hypothetical protein ACOTCG_28110 [Achromobacter xylosoxidans]
MDWKTIIQELGSLGLTQAQIAAEVDLKQSTIAGILSGAQKDMRWQNGERLRQLHARMKAAAQAAPEPATATPQEPSHA